MVLAPDDLVSRFVRQPDDAQPHMLFDLPKTWWSRPYEYAWAAKFAESAGVVIDIASGISHPFKWHLTTLARDVYACDIDPRIVSEEATLKDIQADFGESALQSFDRTLLHRVRRHQCDMTDLPYRDRLFDVVFCISVLEHVAPAARLKALAEFARVLKDDGRIVLTVDYPAVDLDHLSECMTQLGLRFEAAHDFAMPPDALRTWLWDRDLLCVRLLLCKA